ncbi:hypothetical protein [Campylobacter estrildidarum]|uniref:Tetratricopeptide repeat-like domain-containing protein n=1 Tax=Campylobacter estrildidarum TaxID=2510189 RepID=A0A4U7BLD6_9BACT|nr:hypothetical protein [Campylobacter estrildidarum]TKX31331.1 hypothetical protein CQA69_03550 [Campylobacter estrildidarum]
MGLKDDFKAIKTSFNTEEKFIENFIKSERFIQKYKIYIFLLIAILLLWFIISFINTKINEYNNKKSNEIYTSLLNNPNDQNLLNKLQQKNINLYTIFLIQEFAQDSNNTKLKDKIEILKFNSDINSVLKNIIYASLGEKSVFLKDYDKIFQAYQLLKEKKIKQANVLLSQINENSSLNQIAKNLKHYQGISQ